MAEQETVGAPDAGQAEAATVPLSDDIAKAYDELIAADETEAEPAAKAADEDAETAADETEPEATEGDDDAELEASDDGEKPGEDDTEPEDTEDDDDAETIAEAPEHWSQDDKDAFGELPDEQKPLYLEKAKSLEAGYGRKFEELAAKTKEIEPYREFQGLFKPFEQDLATAGITAAQYTRQLVATALQMRQDPEATIRALATQHGVSAFPGKPDNGAGTTADVADLDIDEFTDPAVLKLRDRLLSSEETNRKLLETVEGLSSKFDQSQQSQEQASHQQVFDAWTGFVDAKSDDGSDMHPGAGALRGRVAYELEHVAPPEPGETMLAAFKRAYDTVKVTNPEMLDKIVEARIAERTSEADKKAAAAEREKTRKADLAKAKKAGRTVKSKSAPVGEAPAVGKTNREELERQWDHLSEQSA